MPNEQITPPKTVSLALQKAISSLPVEEITRIAMTAPCTARQWLSLIQNRNNILKKKIKNMRKHYGVQVELMRINDVAVRKITPQSVSSEYRDCAYLDIHGGAYVLHSGLASIEEGILVAARLGIVVYSVDYRMPPSYPCPAAVEDVEAVYRALMERQPELTLFVGGTSAGGGLTLALVQSLIRQCVTLPHAIYVGTPWADLSKTSDSLFVNEGKDSILVSYDGLLSAAALLYAGKHKLNSPTVSPLYGSFESFPPTFLVTGTRDLFLSDTVRVNRCIKAAGGTTQLEVLEGMSHAEYLIFDNTPESNAIYAELKSFFSSKVNSI
ncbi:esterase [Alteromonas sp. V450]|uniref:alpha/beta hydrolase fold domain-containing protein n=1 Tax=Alteromonas sp. V450 TaxID=1912139 RepID=UPI0008FF295B|nr:alpha/beta hydrolase fold domain-containing protein [Alteromonas sp. V450]OJF69570.1 esterase [Alteromonas sp. V450]